MEFKEWEGFKSGTWQKEINVRSFIQKNYTPYEGNSSFLTGTTEKTQKLWNEVLELYKKEHIFITKKTKKNELEMDIKPAIYEMNVVEGKLILFSDSSSAGNVKPNLLLEEVKIIFVIIFYVLIQLILPFFCSQGIHIPHINVL